MKILVVDDDESVRVSMEAFLSHYGHKVLQAENGSIGVDILRDDPDIELVITDLQMSELDGVTLLQILHDRGHTAKKWLMSGTLTPAIILKAKALGAEEVMNKTDVFKTCRDRGLAGVKTVI